MLQVLKNIGHPGGTGIYFGGGANHNVVGGSSPDSANHIAEIPAGLEWLWKAWVQMIIQSMVILFE